MKQRHGGRVLPAAGTLLALGLVVTPVLTACGGSSGASSNTAVGQSATPSKRPTPTPTPTPVITGTAPLTGLATTDPGVRTRPVVTVLLAPTAGQPAPTGLESADVIYEEAGDVPSQRLIAIYQSKDATVGPVGITSPVDAKLLTVYGGIVAYSGGPPSFVKQLDATGLKDMTAVVYPSDYNGSTVSTSTIRSAAGSTAAAPPSMFGFASSGQPFASVGLSPASKITINLPGAPAQQWTYDSKAHRYHPAGATPAGSAVAPANIIVQNVGFHEAYFKNHAGAGMASADIFGRGTGTAYSAGQQTNATWYKPGVQAVTSFADLGNVPLRFTPGPTWIIFAPPGTTVSTS